MNRRTFIKVAAALPIIGSGREHHVAVVAQEAVGQTTLANHIDLAPYLIRVGISAWCFRLEPFVMFPVKTTDALEVLWLQKSPIPGWKSWWECAIREPCQNLLHYSQLATLNPQLS